MHPVKSDLSRVSHVVLEAGRKHFIKAVIHCHKDWERVNLNA